MSSSFSFALRLAVLLAGLSANATYAAPTTAATSNPVSYPSKTCVVSGGKLGSMGRPITYVHSQAGQADRTVLFCCKGCIKKFQKDPAKYLANLDAPAAPAAPITAAAPGK